MVLTYRWLLGCVETFLKYSPSRSGDSEWQCSFQVSAVAELCQLKFRAMVERLHLDTYFRERSESCEWSIRCEPTAFTHSLSRWFCFTFLQFGYFDISRTVGLSGLEKFPTALFNQTIPKAALRQDKCSITHLKMSLFSNFSNLNTTQWPPTHFAVASALLFLHLLFFPLLICHHHLQLLVVDLQNFRGRDVENITKVFTLKCSNDFACHVDVKLEVIYCSF